MKLTFLTFTLFLVLSTFGQNNWQQIGNSISGKSSYENSGSSVSINASGNLIAVGEPSAITSGFDAGRVRVFNLTLKKWTQVGKDIIGDNESDFFGRKVAFSSDGTTLAISGYGNNNVLNRRGFIRIYYWNKKEWVQKGEDIVGEVVNENFGQALSLNGNGNVIAIGGTHNNKNGEKTGVTRAFKYTNNKWMQIGKDFLGTGKDDFFGYSVELNYKGDILAIGALGVNDSIKSRGRVEIYKYNKKSWETYGNSILGKRTNEMAASISLDSSGNVLAIGAPGNNERGQVSIYNYMDKDWKPVKQSLNGETNNPIGLKVVLNACGNILATSGYNELGNVKLYELKNGQWSIINTINGQKQNDWFGCSIGMNSDGSVLIIGAYGSDSNGQLSGQTRVFRK